MDILFSEGLSTPIAARAAEDRRIKAGIGGRPKGAYSKDPTAWCAALSIQVRSQSGAQAKDADGAARLYFEQDPKVKAFFAEMRDAPGAIARMRKRMQKDSTRGFVFGLAQVQGAMAFLNDSVPATKPAKALRELQNATAANARAALAKLSRK